VLTDFTQMTRVNSHMASLQMVALYYNLVLLLQSLTLPKVDLDHLWVRGGKPISLPINRGLWPRPTLSNFGSYLVRCWKQKDPLTMNLFEMLWPWDWKVTKVIVLALIQHPKSHKLYCESKTRPAFSLGRSRPSPHTRTLARRHMQC